MPDSGGLSRRCRWAVLVAVVVTCGVAGCDQASTQDSTRGTSSATVPVPSGAVPSRAGRDDAADRSAVESAYREYWRASETLDRLPERQWPSVLGRVAVDPQLGLVLANARTQKRNGVTVYGHVVPRPTVGPIAGARRARVVDCQDASKSGQADARTGRPRTVGVARNPVEAVLIRGADDRWRVSTVTYRRGTC